MALNISQRKVTKARGSFNDEEVSKLLYLELRKIANKLDHTAQRLEGRSNRELS